MYRHLMHKCLKIANLDTGDFYQARTVALSSIPNRSKAAMGFIR